MRDILLSECTSRHAPGALFHNLFLFFCIEFVPDVPDAGNHQTADGVPAHGNRTPPRISPSCPHCDVCGWAGVSLSPLPVLAVPGAARYLQPGVCRSPYSKLTKNCFSLFVRIMTQPLTWLVRSSRAAKATCLMNGYSIFRVQVKGSIKILSPNVLKTGWC